MKILVVLGTRPEVLKTVPLALKLKEIWAIRVRLQLAANHRDLALFNLSYR